eukprot:1184399-Prorocentrum_minimum.AAC.3
MENSPQLSPALLDGREKTHFVSEGNGRKTVIRYFSTITPKDDGSLILWQNPPRSFTGPQLKEYCLSKGLPLEVRAFPSTPMVHPSRVFHMHLKSFDVISNNKVCTMFRSTFPKCTTSP